MMRAIIFFGILFLLTIYLGLKVNLLVGNRKFLSAFITLFLFAISVSWIFLYRGNARILETTWYPILMWVGNITMGLLGTFILFSLVLDAISVVFWFWDKMIVTEVADAERRRALFKMVSGGIAATSAVMAAAGYYTSQYGLKVKKVEISLPDLAEALKKLKIVQISDLHIGLTIDKSYVQGVIDQILILQPDIVVITGDMVDGTPEDLEDRWQPLRDLKAPHGVFFITGNHEYYSGAESWIQLVRELGFIPLINENKRISFENTEILMAGIPDAVGEQFLESHIPDVKKARGDQNQTADLKILLAHRPEAYEEAANEGFDILLSGHTHAGQFFPFNVVVMFAHKFYKGLNRHENLWVYVNQGTGYWGPANRFALPPEITLFNFVRTDGLS